jgi:hypothetical protein
VVRSNYKLRSVTFLATLASVLLPAGVFAAPGDFYPAYQQAEVIAHLRLSGSVPTQMFLQQQGRKEYLYVQHSGQKGFTVVDVSKAKGPKVVTNMPQQNIAALGSGLAITDKSQANSDHAFAKDGQASRGGDSTPQSIKVLDLSDPSHPRTVQTFNGVTSIVTDSARGLVYLANAGGIWVLSHQPYLRRHLCSSSDAISGAEPNCD